jgi:hypothetical protein
MKNFLPQPAGKAVTSVACIFALTMTSWVGLSAPSFAQVAQQQTQNVDPGFRTLSSLLTIIKRKPRPQPLPAPDKPPVDIPTPAPTPAPANPLDIAQFQAQIQDATGAWINLLADAKPLPGDFNDPRCAIPARMYVLRKVGDVQYYGLVQAGRLSVIAQRDLIILTRTSSGIPSPTFSNVTVNLRLNGISYSSVLANGVYGRIAETARMPWDWNRVRTAANNGVFLVSDPTLMLGALGGRATGRVPSIDLRPAGSFMPENSSGWPDGVRSGQGGSYESSRAPHHGWISQAVYAAVSGDTSWLQSSENALRLQAEWAGYFPQWSSWDSTNHRPLNVTNLMPITLYGNAVAPDGRFVPVPAAYQRDVSHHYNGRGLAYTASCDAYHLLNDQMNSTYAQYETFVDSGPLSIQQDRGTGDAIAAATMAFQLTPANTPAWMLPKSYFEGLLRGQGRIMMELPRLAWHGPTDIMAMRKSLGSIVTSLAPVSSFAVTFENGQQGRGISAFFITGRVIPALWLAKRAGINEFDIPFQRLSGYVEAMGQARGHAVLGCGDNFRVTTPEAPDTMTTPWRSAQDWIAWVNSLPTRNCPDSNVHILGDYPQQLGSALQLIKDANRRGWVTINTDDELAFWMRRGTALGNIGQQAYLGQVFGQQP